VASERIEGSCLCGGVRYAAEGPLHSVACCHCDQCRKASGAEFATNGTVAGAGFRVLEGELLLAEWEVTPGQPRVFCSRCGSPLFSRRPDGNIRLRLGCVDTPLDARPQYHVFVSEKPAWSEIHGALPQFDRTPPLGPRRAP
jgi:hypothetical protein